MSTITKGIKRIPFPLILLLFGLLFFLPFLGTFELTAITEGEYSGVAREMVNRSEFISPYFNNTFWADKPPVHLWLLVFFGKLGGWSEFSLRLPGVLMSILTGLLIYHIGQKYYSKKTGFSAALIFFTTIEMIIAGQIIFVDMTLTFFIVLALYFFLRFFTDGRRRSSICCFFLACAGAVLTKGLIGLLIPGGGALVYLFWNKEWDVFKQHAKDLLIGFFLFLLVSVPWFVVETFRHGDAFINRFFIYFNIERFTKGVDNVNPWYYYLVIVPLTFFPWSAFPRTIASSFKLGENKKLNRVILSLSLFTILFFSISKTKLHTYLLPLYPFWSLMTAVGWERIWAKKERSLWSLFAGTLILFPLTMIALFILSSNTSGNNVSFLTLPVLITFGAALFLIIFGIIRRTRNGSYYFSILVVMILTTNLILKGYILPYMQEHYLYVKDFSHIIAAQYQPGDKIETPNRSLTNLVFYTQRQIDFNPQLTEVPTDGSRAFLIVPKSSWKAEYSGTILKEKAGWLLVIKH